MKRIPYVILILAAAASCAKQGYSDRPLPAEEIRFSTSKGGSILSKADSGEDVEDFAVYGWNTGNTPWSAAASLGTDIFTNTQAIKSSDSYVTVGEKKYWGDGNYHFAAYGPYMANSPATFEGVGDSFKMKFTDYVTSTSTVDLIYSDFATDKIKADGIVPLEFKHSLSKILFVFEVNDEELATDTGITSIEVIPVSISLGKVFTKGSFTFDGTNATWTDLSGIGNIANTEVVKSTAGYDAYVIPQDLTAESSFAISYDIVFNSGETAVTAGPFQSGELKFLDGATGTWSQLKMGKQYTVKIKVNAFTGAIEVIPGIVEDWATGSGTIETK